MLNDSLMILEEHMDVKTYPKSTLHLQYSVLLIYALSARLMSCKLRARLDRVSIDAFLWKMTSYSEGDIRNISSDNSRRNDIHKSRSRIGSRI
jgi:hypothetical protein